MRSIVNEAGEIVAPRQRVTVRWSAHTTASRWRLASVKSWSGKTPASLSTLRPSSGIRQGLCDVQLDALAERLVRL